MKDYFIVHLDHPWLNFANIIAERARIECAAPFVTDEYVAPPANPKQVFPESQFYQDAMAMIRFLTPAPSPISSLHE